MNVFGIKSEINVYKSSMSSIFKELKKLDWKQNQGTILDHQICLDAACFNS